MVILRMEEDQHVLVEEGEYIGELTSVQEVKAKYGLCLRFVFTICDGDYDGISVSALCSYKLTPGNKLDGILRGLGVEPLEVGEQIDTEELIGRKARIYIEHGTDDSGRTYNNVTKVKLLKTHKASQSSNAPAQAQASHSSNNVQAKPNLGVKEVKEEKTNDLGVSIVDEIQF